MCTHPQRTVTVNACFWAQIDPKLTLVVATPHGLRLPKYIKVFFGSIFEKEVRPLPTAGTNLAPLLHLSLLIHTVHPARMDTGMGVPPPAPAAPPKLTTQAWQERLPRTAAAHGHRFRCRTPRRATPVPPATCAHPPAPGDHTG